MGKGGRKQKEEKKKWKNRKKGRREREMAGIEPGPGLLKYSAEKKRERKKNGIETSQLKHTLNNSCYSLTAWGEHSHPIPGVPQWGLKDSTPASPVPHMVE